MGPTAPLATLPPTKPTVHDWYGNNLDPQAQQKQLEDAFGKDNVRRAQMHYHRSNNQDQMMESLEEGRRAALDRQQGHSYSIHVK
jgi:hypothetical protein